MSGSADREETKPIIEPEVLMTRDIERTDSWDRAERERDIRQGIDLATTLERIEKNFVITDPRLPDNPIVRLLLFSFPGGRTHNLRILVHFNTSNINTSPFFQKSTKFLLPQWLAKNYFAYLFLGLWNY